MAGKVGKELVGSRTYQPRIYLAVWAKMSWEPAPFSPSQAPQARGLSLFVKLKLPSGLSLFRAWLSGVFLQLRAHCKEKNWSMWGQVRRSAGGRGRLPSLEGEGRAPGTVYFHDVLKMSPQAANPGPLLGGASRLGSHVPRR